MDDPLIQTVDIRAAAALAGSSPPGDPPSVDPAGTIDPGSGQNPPVDGQNPSGGGGGQPEGGRAPTLEIAQLTALPTPLRPGDGGQLGIHFFVTGPATVQIQILRGGKVIKSYSPRELDAAGWVDARWNGKNRRERLVHRGRYTVAVRAWDELGGSEASLQVRVVP